MTQTPSFRDVEKLSAYLDGQLKPSEVARLESRLQTEPQLASIFKELRQTRSLLRQLPQRRAPRNFTLTPKMVGQKPPLPRTYPVFRFATVLATLFLFLTFATNFMAPRLVRTGAPYPPGVAGYGGGGGGEAETELQMDSMPAEEPAPAGAPEAPATPLKIPPSAPTEMVPTSEDNARVGTTPEVFGKSGVQPIPTGEGFAQQATIDEAEQPQPVARPISSKTQITLAGIALLSGLIAIILRYTAIRKWRAKAK